MGFWNYKRVGGVRSSDPACFWLWVKGSGLKMEGCRFEAVYRFQDYCLWSRAYRCSGLGFLAFRKEPLKVSLQGALKVPLIKTLKGTLGLFV